MLVEHGLCAAGAYALKWLHGCTWQQMSLNAHIQRPCTGFSTVHCKANEFNIEIDQSGNVRQPGNNNVRHATGS